jgi:nucleotide-binding universal stress UspA family protein
MVKVLCCIDGSDHSLKAVEFAEWLADARQCPLVLVAVNQLRPTSGFSPLKQWQPEELNELFRTVRRRMAGGRGQAPEQVTVDAFDVPHAIIDCTASEGCDHIVVGTGDPPFLGKLLLGSVSEAVVAKAPCTVTVVR